MAQTVTAPDLFTGMRMEREEFMRRWEALPDLKNAELVEGIVFVSSPVGWDHGSLDSHMIFWLKSYAAHVAGIEVANNTTCYLLESAPQPDALLRFVITAEHGKYATSPPELIVEVCESSYSHDLGPKRALYQRAGVREYITVETLARRLRWRHLEDGSYVDLKPGEDGVLRSRIFQGLWLDPQHVWALDASGMLALLEQARKEPV